MKERELLKLLQQKLKVGDDCAIIPYRGTNLVLTTDMLHQSTDFPWGTTPYTIGWRVAAVSLSDLAAMGAKPLTVLVALGAPKFEPEFVKALAKGVKDCCNKVGAAYLGGDLDRHNELTLVTTALGVVKRPVLRKGTKVGELVCLSGELGRTAVALEFFEHGDIKRANELFRFAPRIAEGRRIGRYATSMIDISDGLARSLYQLAEVSNVGFQIDYEKIPILPEVKQLSQGEREEMEMALYTGEDFELLFTVPADLKTKVKKESHVIGEVAESGEGILLKCGSRLIELEDRGYEH
jgi:thiamine-monophosphate kinase